MSTLLKFTCSRRCRRCLGGRPTKEGYAKVYFYQPAPESLGLEESTCYHHILIFLSRGWVSKENPKQHPRVFPKNSVFPTNFQSCRTPQVIQWTFFKVRMWIWVLVRKPTDGWRWVKMDQTCKIKRQFRFFGMDDAVIIFIWSSIIHMFFVKTSHTCCWWFRNPAPGWYGAYLSFYRVIIYISTGAGFLPSTVSPSPTDAGNLRFTRGDVPR